MEIECNPAKREQVLAARALDMARCGEVFDAFHLTRQDDKHSDVESRFISVGTLGQDVVIVVWTSRAGLRRIITMWKANDREKQNFEKARSASG